MEEYDILDLSHVGKAVDSEWPSWYSCIKIIMLAWAISTDTPLFQYINIFGEATLDELIFTTENFLCIL